MQDILEHLWQAVDEAGSDDDAQEHLASIRQALVGRLLSEVSPADILAVAVERAAFDPHGADTVKDVKALLEASKRERLPLAKLNSLARLEKPGTSSGGQVAVILATKSTAMFSASFPEGATYKTRQPGCFMHFSHSRQRRQKDFPQRREMLR